MEAVDDAKVIAEAIKMQEAKRHEFLHAIIVSRCIVLSLRIDRKSVV